MTKNTLTTLKNLQPGDRFTFESGIKMGIKYTKVEGEPVYRWANDLFDCWAIQDGTETPVPMKGKFEVVFIGKIKS